MLQQLTCHLKSLSQFLMHCMKIVQIRSFFWSVFSCIYSEYRKTRTRKNPVFGHFTQLREFRVRASYFSTSVIFVCKFTFYFSPKVLLSVTPRILRLLKQAFFFFPYQTNTTVTLFVIGSSVGMVLESINLFHSHYFFVYFTIYE